MQLGRRRRTFRQVCRVLPVIWTKVGILTERAYWGCAIGGGIGIRDQLGPVCSGCAIEGHESVGRNRTTMNHIDKGEIHIFPIGEVDIFVVAMEQCDTKHGLKAKKDNYQALPRIHF